VNTELQNQLFQAAPIRLHVKRVYEKYNSNLSKTDEALKAARNTVRKYLE